MIIFTKLILKQNHYGIDLIYENGGAKLFGRNVEEAPGEEKGQLKASALLAHVQSMDLPFKTLKISLRGDDVVVTGEVHKQVDSEKIALTLGNIEGVDTVDNNMTVATPMPEARYHTVVSGDWLSKIADKYYGDPQKYDVIFEANKPMLEHPDKIYPG